MVVFHSHQLPLGRPSRFLPCRHTHESLVLVVQIWRRFHDGQSVIVVKNNEATFQIGLILHCNLNQSLRLNRDLRSPQQSFGLLRTAIAKPGLHLAFRPDFPLGFYRSHDRARFQLAHANAVGPLVVESYQSTVVLEDGAIRPRCLHPDIHLELKFAVVAIRLQIRRHQVFCYQQYKRSHTGTKQHRSISRP